MSRVLVSGATGYIATHVVKNLLEAGYKVRGTVRDLQNKDKYNHLYSLTANARSNLEIVQGDLHDAACWVPAVKGCEYVCHVASPFPAGAPKNEDELIIPAREGTLNVLKAAAAERSVKRVVLTSSMAAVIEVGGNEVALDESAWADPAKLKDAAYNKSKVIAERAAWDFHKTLDPKTRYELCAVNPVFVFGPCLHPSSGTSVALIKMLLEGHFPVIPDFVFPVVDVRDVATAHVKCLTSPAAKDNRHILWSENIRYQKVAEILNAEFGPQGYNIPTTLMDQKVLEEAVQANPMLAYLYVCNSKPMKFNNARFTKVLGVTPIDQAKTVNDTAYSLIEFGAIPKTDKYRGPKK